MNSADEQGTQPKSPAEDAGAAPMDVSGDGSAQDKPAGPGEKSRDHPLDSKARPKADKLSRTRKRKKKGKDSRLKPDKGRSESSRAVSAGKEDPEQSADGTAKARPRARADRPQTQRHRWDRDTAPFEDETFKTMFG